MAELAGFSESLLKEWGKQAVAGQDILLEDPKPISTGSVRLDWALVNPFVEGSINEIYSEEGCGKTTLALEVCANATQMGKQVYYFDLERKLVRSQVQMVKGLNLSLFIRIRPDNGEEAVNKVLECLNNSPGCVIIFDSLTAMLPEVEDSEDAEKQQMGAVAKLAAKMIRKINGPTERNKCMVLFISHITAKMNPYQSGDLTKGGKAVKDIAAQRVRLKKTESSYLKDKKGNVYGQMTSCKVIKNNQGPPCREVEFPIIFGRGIDRILDLLQFAKELGVIEYTKGGGWYTFEDVKRQESDMLEALTNDVGLRTRVAQKLATVI
jgi:recombination protein RecA